jgi:glyoxylase-like metal-dependent hydrolase (beta-lactamase superfamily II)
MKTSSFRSFVSCVFIIFLFQCSQTENLIIKHQVTGPADANCYLIYGTKTKEAALIDVAGPIDTLMNYVKENNLTLEYFFFTHGHFDHIMGLPEFRDQFPDAKICIHKDDYNDMLVQLEWVLNNMGQEFIDYLKNDPKLSTLLKFDVTTFGDPDIFIEDNQVFEIDITVIHLSQLFNVE